MINILCKSDCCGCESCVQACPKQCINFKKDSEGFYYPHVNLEECISCGTCEKVCPILNPYSSNKAIDAYAAINKNDEIRRQSSSGGIFSLFAEKVIDDGGVVFGAKYNREWQVVISYTDTKDGLIDFRGSKYSQARVGKSFKQCKEFLNSNRKVLFTGTPCQIAGLNHYLQKDYNNLTTCEVVCHGVPSPLVIEKYLNEIKNDANSQIVNLDFRNKLSGWKNYSVVINTQSHSIITPYRENLFMRAFLNDLILRPSCYECKAKAGRSHSDITIADFWGIGHLHPEMDDNKGTTLLIINTKKGNKLLSEVDSINVIETSLNDALSFNPAYFKSAKPHRRRNYFFKKLDSSESIIHLINKSLRPNLYQTIKKEIKNIARIALKLNSK